MKRISLKSLAAAAGLLGLAACNHDSNSTVTTAPVAPASFQAMFGTTFAADFNADANSTPPHPSANDVPALNLSALPLDN